MRCIMILKKIPILICSLAIFSTIGNAQINRPYEPIIITGDTLSQFSNYEIQNLYLYAYDADVDSWRMIPFQFDEVNADVEDSLKYFVPEDSLGGLLDDDDELVFILGDLGDKADSTKWLDGADSIRYEINFYDSLDGQTGYVYLYFSKTITEQIPNTYEMAYDDLNDRIMSANYEVGFNNTGQLSDVAIKSGSGIDIFDRIKIRLYGLLTLIPFPVPVNEESIEAKSAYAKAGAVRIIRNLNARFYYDLGILDPYDEPFVQTSFFYPWSSSFSITGIPIDDIQNYADLLYARLSWDMNKNATNMKFFSESNDNGIIVDGSGEHEGINATSKKNDLDWAMITGAQGTMLNIFYVPALGDSQGIFYYDNNDDSLITNGDPVDFQPYLIDTGDSVAYGDCGYFVINNIVGEEFDFIYHNYFLHPDFSPDSASLLCNQTRDSLVYYTQIQYKPISKVTAAETASRLEFELYQNYPNPFNNHTIISFSLAKTGHVSLIVYDVLGKQIKKIIDEELSANTYKYSWSGNDDQGNSVSSGLYFCKLKVGNEILTNKILLIK